MSDRSLIVTSLIIEDNFTIASPCLQKTVSMTRKVLPNDRPENLDYDRFARVTFGLAQVIADFTGTKESLN